MDYKQATEYIESCYAPSTKRGFGDLRAILSRLGNPQNGLNVVHVAGTNGKGSVCAMLSSVLRAAGFSVGAFTSPHLARFNERINVDGTDVSDEELARLVYLAKGAVEGVLGAGERVSFFQLLTICAFVLFAEKRVGFVILEAGIGGRLDATNVIDDGALSVITSISVDHADVLGATVAEIAWEKAGIIKESGNTVLSFQSEAVYNVISGVCRERNANLIYEPREDVAFDVKRRDTSGFVFGIKSPLLDYDGAELNLAGEYQLDNAHTALLAVKALRDGGFGIPAAAVYDGLRSVKWAGRMEVVAHNPVVVLDGAHNAGGAEQFAAAAARLFKDDDVIIVVGILKGKEYGEIIRVICGLPFVRKIICTTPRYAAKAVEAERLAEECRRHGASAEVELDCYRAVDIAREDAGAKGVVCCVGSLYLVGDIRCYSMKVI